MTEFDSGEYERRQNNAYEEAESILRARPEFASSLDAYGRGPTITLTCPKGHRLLKVYADVADRISIAPLPDHVARRSGSVTRVAEPWRHGHTVCQHPGCPVAIDHEGTCARHGDKHTEVIGGVRTEFFCRQCGGRRVALVTTARLLKLYGIAVITGQAAIPIGTPAG